MKIYEIDQAILECVDMETGEIIDVEKLDALVMERDSKLDNLVSWYKSELAAGEAIKAEASKLTERANQKFSKAEKLKNYLVGIVNGQKFETPRNKISWRKSEAVNFTDEDLIPNEFKVECIETTLDKAAIKNAIKSGVNVPGAELIKNNNIQIK